METANVEEIFAVLDQLKAASEKVQTKIVDINKTIHRYNQNALLDLDNLYLTFQIALLNNEKKYYGSMARLVQDKLYNDLVRIYEKILMLLTSLEILDIDNSEEINNIITSVRKAQRSEVITSTEVMNLAACSSSNLDLVKRFIDLFDAYIRRLEVEHRQENIHCANLTVTLKIRKQHIEVEHAKYQSQLNDLFAYFVECTRKIRKQLEHQDVLFFLTAKNGGDHQADQPDPGRQ